MAHPDRLPLCAQECDIIVEHAFDQEIQQGGLIDGWEATRRFSLCPGCSAGCCIHDKLLSLPFCDLPLPCRGCIFETVPSQQAARVATQADAYIEARSAWPCSQEACYVLMSPKMKKLVAVLLGRDGGQAAQPFLFNDQVLCLCWCLHHPLSPIALTASTFLDVQYIVKPARCHQSAFNWHKDSDWCPDRSHSRYVSLWCALDDATPGNDIQEACFAYCWHYRATV